MGNYTVYVNPYIVLKSGGYSKHYYIEGQRIVSKLGDGLGDPTNGSKAGGESVSYGTKQEEAREAIVKNLKFLGQDGSILTAGNSRKTPPGQISTKGNTGGKEGEQFQYFYHPDHLGSSSYITDASGEVYQHLEYFAFGETFVEEHSNSNRTPYLFNGKELDEETGLYYYGARYYEPAVSIWLSVDPMTEELVGWNPYAYARNNPIIFIDPDGQWPPAWWQAHGTRVIGGLKVIGGVGEMIVGGAAILTPEPTMITKVVGVAAVAHGSDVVSSGLTQLLTGEDQSSLTSKALQTAGMSKGNADLVDGAVSIALTGGAGALVNTTKVTNASQLSNITSNAANQGKTVLGKFPDYLDLASDLGAKRFSIPTNIWNKMTPTEQWAANVKFLDRAISRGDKIILSNKVSDISKVTGAFRKELDYLIEKGYQLSDDGLEMIK